MRQGHIGILRYGTYWGFSVDRFLLLRASNHVAVSIPFGVGRDNDLGLCRLVLLVLELATVEREQDLDEIKGTIYEHQVNWIHQAVQ